MNFTRFGLYVMLSPIRRGLPFYLFSHLLRILMFKMSWFNVKKKKLTPAAENKASGGLLLADSDS